LEQFKNIPQAQPDGFWGYLKLMGEMMGAVSHVVTVRTKGVLASGQNTVEVWITELNGAQLS